MWKNLKKIADVLIKDFLKQFFIYDTHAVFISLSWQKVTLIPTTKAARDNSCHIQQKKDTITLGKQKNHQV